MTTQVRIEGLKEFRKDLKALGPEWARELRDLNYETAQKVVVKARANASTKQERSVAATLKASKLVSGAQASMGGEPYTLGAEFGAVLNIPRAGKGWKGGTIKGWNQFRPWRGNGMDAGYFLFPAIRAETDDAAMGRYMDRLEDIARRAFPD